MNRRSFFSTLASSFGMLCLGKLSLDNKALAAPSSIPLNKTACLLTKTLTISDSGNRIIKQSNLQFKSDYIWQANEMVDRIKLEWKDLHVHTPGYKPTSISYSNSLLNTQFSLLIIEEKVV